LCNEARNAIADALQHQGWEIFYYCRLSGSLEILSILA
jgi:ferredoxin